MRSKIGSLLKIAAVAGVSYLAVGEAVYEVVLGKKYTEKKNLRREISEDIFTFYGKPEDQTDADAWFVAMHPEDTVIVNSKGKKMYANIFLQNEYTDKWAIVVHGYTSCPRAMADQAHHFYKNGFNVLMPHLVSFCSDEEKYASMGYHDKDYVKDWIIYIVHNDLNARIAVLGVSMGSATTMMLTGESDLPSNVKCAIADCGYTSWWEEMGHEMKNTYKAPIFPFMYAANTVSKLRGNFDFKKSAPVKAVANSKTPTLFIHGENDKLVPPYMLDKVFDACTADKQKLPIPDAFHADSNEIHPEIYYPAVFSFVDKYL